ncbi:MAG: tRNA (adenosine(37)-N6)-threonylcarbamoyltransferase complex dimerization subunit type 1 TsaB, partial [Brevinema sp.]
MKPKNILAIDTSIAKNLVVAFFDGSSTSSIKYEIEDLESDLIPIITQRLSEKTLNVKDIDLFMIGAGPGSFMGLRLGFSVLRTWAWLYKKSIITLSSLDLLISSLNNDTKGSIIIPCIDAKMKRV